MLYTIAFIDRINVGFAALSMSADLGLTPAAFGLGAGVAVTLQLTLLRIVGQHRLTPDGKGVEPVFSSPAIPLGPRRRLLRPLPAVILD